MFLQKFQIILEIPHLLCEREMFLLRCQIILEIIFQIITIFEIISVKSSCCEVHAGPTCGNKTPILKIPNCLTQSSTRLWQWEIICCQSWRGTVREPWPYVYQVFLEGILVIVIVLLLLRSRFSEDHHHMCSTSYERKSWSWLSSFSFPKFSWKPWWSW